MVGRWDKKKIIKHMLSSHDQLLLQHLLIQVAANCQFAKNNS